MNLKIQKINKFYSIALKLVIGKLTVNNIFAHTKIIQLLFIPISSIFFNLAFLCPGIFWFLPFFFLIPIFYLTLKYNVTFKIGFYWGIITYLQHFYYFLIIINQKGTGNLKYLLFLAWIIYFSIYSGFWFYLLSFELFRLNLLQYCYKILITFFYFYTIYNFAFLIFGYNAGYVLSHPLLPLANNVIFLKSLSVFGLWLLTFILIVFSFLFSIFLVSFSFKILFFAFFILIPFLYGFFLKDNHHEQISLNRDNLGFIQFECLKDESIYDATQKLKFKINELVSKNPNLDILLTHESCFSFALNKYPEIINWFYCDLKNKKIHIFLCAYRIENRKKFNTVYHLFDGKIINFYDKQYPVFFCEFIPKFWNYFKFSNLFLQNKKSFEFGDEIKEFKINQFKFSPLICSDFFLIKQFENLNKNIFLFMDESWFYSEYSKNLLYLYIKLKSYEFKKNIILISRFKMNFFFNSGILKF